MKKDKNEEFKSKIIDIISRIIFSSGMFVIVVIISTFIICRFVFDNKQCPTETKESVQNASHDS